MTRRLRSLDDDPKLVAQVWLATRLVLALVAVFVMRRYELSFVEVVRRWDVEHFLGVARNGYANPLDVAFFPGLPALLRGGMLVGLAPEVTGVLLALVGSVFSTWAIYRLGGGVAACLWLIAPTTIFTAVPYTEALFCAAAFWAWERARQGHWATAAGCAALACTFRVSGLFLIGALVVMAITEPPLGRADTRSGRLLRLGWLLLPAAVLAGYAYFLHGLTGSWTAWFDAQTRGWSRSFTTPWQSLQHTLTAASPTAWPGRPEVAWVFRAEIVSMAVGLVTTIWCLTKRWWAEASWVGIQVLAFGISYWFMSVNRALLLWFPTFILASWLLQWRPRGNAGLVLWRLLGAVLLAIDLVVMVVWAWLFLSGRWAS